MNREDRVHGALLILNELVRISSMEGEVMVISLFKHSRIQKQNIPLIVLSAISACVRRWRRSHSSSWSMINTARSWWDLEPSLAISHPSPASNPCNPSSPTLSWVCWATAHLRASSALELHQCRPRLRWWKADTAVSWWKSVLTRWICHFF